MSDYQTLTGAYAQGHSAGIEECRRAEMLWPSIRDLLTEIYILPDTAGIWRAREKAREALDLLRRANVDDEREVARE